MYYEDLSKYRYGRIDYDDNHLNVGWLDDDDYTKGDFENKNLFLDKIRKMKVSSRTKGFHNCPFCGDRSGSGWSSSIEYMVKGGDKYYHSPSMLYHYVKEHDYKPPQEFIDAVINTKVKEKPKFKPRRRAFKGISEAGSSDITTPILGPINDFDSSSRNPRIVGNVLSSDPGVFNGLDTNEIDDDYFIDSDKHDIVKDKIKKAKKRRIKRFRDMKEGAGFGLVDYKNVTGDATTSGYLGDKQPTGSGSASNIVSNLPRAEYYSPKTNVVGFKRYSVEDPYFLRKLKKKLKQKKRELETDKRVNYSKKFNDKFIKDIPEE